MLDAVGILMAGAIGFAGPIQVHGHRGARAMRPENTLPAFEYAIGVGVDVLELDMAVTKDNVVVVSHDPLLHEPGCTGPKNGVGGCRTPAGRPGSPRSGGGVKPR